MLTVDLENNNFNSEFQTDDVSSTQNSGSDLVEIWSFDSTTKLNICSGKDGASPQDCTINSDFVLFDNYFLPKGEYPYGYGTMATGIHCFKENEFFNGVN